MPATFCPDWRCASTGMSDLDANRIGIATRMYQGVWGDWVGKTPNNSKASPSYRIVVNEQTGQIVGATVYGSGAAKWMPLLRLMIDQGQTVVDLHALACTSPTREPVDGAVLLPPRQRRPRAPLPR